MRKPKHGIFIGLYNNDGTRKKLPKSYITWAMMKQRCYNKNHQAYKRYAGRGITVCKEWINSFETFYNDMNESMEEHIKKYGKMNTTLDRINNNKGYSKENCRWATRKEQCNNTSNNRYLKIEGEDIGIEDFCKKTKLTKSKVYIRIKAGYGGDTIFNGRAYLKRDSLRQKIKKLLLSDKITKINIRTIEILGYYSNKNISMTTISNKYSLSAERIRQIIKSGVEKLEA